MPKRKKGWLHYLLLNKRALCENHHLSKRRRVEGVHEVEKLPPKVEPMRCGYSSLPSPANYDCYTPSLQRNAISEFMDYSQRIRKQPKLDCHAVCFWPGNPTFVANAQFEDGPIFQAEGSNKKEARTKAADMALRQVSKSTVVQASQGTGMTLAIPDKDPVSALMELAQSSGLNVRIEQASQTGPSHCPTFYMAARLGKQQFDIVTGKNLNETKNRATAEALRQLKKQGLYTQKQNATEEIPLSIQTWHDRVAVETLTKFRSLVASVSEDLSGRKVLAAILLYDDNKDQLSVVSLGTGNCFVTGDNLCDEGSVINDSHAEIIAKRGFQRYLFKEIYCLKDRRLFERTLSGTLKVMPHLTFHLYISLAPCGDGAVFTRSDPEDTVGDHSPVFRKRQHGLLRTKVEKGEGTIPTDDIPQTLDGIRRGQRLRTMSCSDKICRWNVVGIQGALLSLFLEPIYLSSITLGMLFNDGHMSRAMCCRVDRKGQRLTGLPRGYRAQHPDLGCVTRATDTRTVDRSSPLSVNWNMSDNGVEVTDGARGMTTRNTASRLCKRSLFLSFSRINCWQDIGQRTYRETKDLAKNYGDAKEVFESAMYENGYGQWVRKPPEVDLFYL